MASTPNTNLHEIPSLGNVAVELDTLLHCSKNGLVYSDDKVVRCLKAAILLACKEAEIRGFEKAIAIVKQNVDTDVQAALVMLRRNAAA